MADSKTVNTAMSLFLLPRTCYGTVKNIIDDKKKDRAGKLSSLIIWSAEVNKKYDLIFKPIYANSLDEAKPIAQRIAKKESFTKYSIFDISKLTGKQEFYMVNKSKKWCDEFQHRQNGVSIPTKDDDNIIPELLHDDILARGGVHQKKRVEVYSSFK